MQAAMFLLKADFVCHQDMKTDFCQEISFKISIGKIFYLLVP